MDYHEKVEAHIAELSRRGINKHITAPPHFRLLWVLGLKVPPPLFLPFLANMGIASLLVLIDLYVVALGLALIPNLYVVAVGLGLVPASIWMPVVWILISLLGGVANAIYYQRKSRSLNFPSWQDYAPAP
jgi:Family of unknown function (DUF6404)